MTTTTLSPKSSIHTIYIYTSFNYRMTISSINTIKESIGQFVLNQLNVEIPTIYIYVCVALSNAEPDKMLLIKKKKDAVIIIKQSPINASMSCIYIYIVVVVVIIYYCCYSVV